MSVDLIQHASIAGELAKNLWGRTDFEKYDAAWARAHNWMVDYRGGLMTRPGFEFGDYIKWAPGENIKFVEFQFSPDIANTYLCIFTHLEVRFVQDNAYVLESQKNITGVTFVGANVFRFDSVAHGYVNGDWVKLSGFTEPTLRELNGRTVRVAASFNDTFQVEDIITGARLSKTGAVTGTGKVARIYTLASPFGQTSLARLQAVQIRDTVRFTHPNFAIRNLIRNGATNWEFKLESIGRKTFGQANPPRLRTKSHTENGYFVYQVTAVNVDGEESLPGLGLIGNGPNIMGETDRALTIMWDRVPQTLYYNVYRSRQTRDPFYSDMTVGYIGQSTGLDFSDPGITPDFTKQPLRADNPFANSRILYVTVTAGGDDYHHAGKINWPPGGSGAQGFLVVVVNRGPIRGLKVLDGGRNYTGTNITANGGNDAAVMTATLSAPSGNDPHCCAVFEQRMLYGATNEHPLRIFGSRPGFLSNFDVSDLSTDDDAYGFDLDSERISAIRHLIPIRGGILVFNEIGMWLVNGRNNAPLTANNANAELQNATGASHVRPIYVDSFVVYINSDGQEIRLLSYEDNAKVFSDNNLALLSNHLFNSSNQITSLSYVPVPFKMLYTTQRNGRLLALTVDAANSVYACTPQWTQGNFVESLSISEDNTSQFYVGVSRRLGNNQVMFFERQASRQFTQLEEACCADACLMLGKTTPNGRLTPSSFTGSVVFTASGNVFAAGDVGKVLRAGSGKATIQAFTSATQVSGTWTRDLKETENESSVPKLFESGEWSLDQPVSTIRGLAHLEGQPVAVLADGEVVEGKVVEGGKIELDTPVTRAIIGLGYTCIAQTLPMTTRDLPIEMRKKDIVGVSLRLHESAGLKYGSSLNKLYSFAYRQRRLGWAAPDLRDEVVHEVPSSAWDYDNQMYFVQDSPLPATILNFVRDMDLGDDKGE